VLKRILYRLQNRLVRSYGNEIDYGTLVTMVRNNSKVFLIDVRTEDEFEYEHLDGAINIPLQDLKDKIEKIVKDKNDIIIAYCQYGGRSRKACTKMEKVGYKNVYNLKNGLDGI